MTVEIIYCTLTVEYLITAPAHAGPNDPHLNFKDRPCFGLATLLLLTLLLLGTNSSFEMFIRD